MTGVEPANGGITILCLNHLATPTIAAVKNYSKNLYWFTCCVQFRRDLIGLFLIEAMKRNYASHLIGHFNLA